MSKLTVLMLPLFALLIACAGNQEVSPIPPIDGHADADPISKVEQEQDNWPNPEQEKWVEEPVFHGKLHLVEAGRRNPQTLVLIHGLGDRGLLDWQEVLPELSDKYHVITIDLPGFGSSDKHQILYAPQKYAELINWVVDQLAHGEVVIIGHSMGGAVSLRYAHDYPEQVSRLVMVDAAGILQRTVFVKHMAKAPVSYEWLDPYQSRIPGLKGIVEKIAGKTDDLTRSMLVTMDQFPDIPRLMMSNGLAKQYLYKDYATMNAALGLVYEDFSLAAREVEIPTHIIWGTEDSVAPVRTGVVLADLLPNAELHQISGAGHVPMTDSFEVFMDTLEYALENEPRARQAHKRLVEVNSEVPIKKTVRCDGRDKQVFTGHYQSLQLKNCHDAFLHDLVAESIVLVESDANLENVQLHSTGTALLAVDSVVTATLLQIDARIGLAVDGSYLDIAGATIVTSKELIDIRQNSQIYFSLSEHMQDDQVRTLHGVSLGPDFDLQ